MSRHPFRPLPGSRLAHTADIITGTELTSRWECDSTHSKGANRKWLGVSLTKPEKWIRHTPQQNLKTLHPVKKEKRLEREVACHSHFGVEIRLWVHYTSLWCEVCLSAVSQRKESIRWAMFPFLMYGSNFERSRLCWRLISILLCEKLKKNLEVKLWKLLWPLRHHPLQQVVKKLVCSGLPQVYRNINCDNWTASFMFLNHIIIFRDIGRESRKQQISIHLRK